MSRVKNSKNSRARRKTILSRTKGFVGGRNNRLRQAQETLKRAAITPSAIASKRSATPEACGSCVSTPPRANTASATAA